MVVATPSFSLYALQARALGARVIEVPLRPPDAPAGTPFAFPVAELARAAREHAAGLVLLGFAFSFSYQAVRIVA